MKHGLLLIIILTINNFSIGQLSEPILLHKSLGTNVVLKFTNIDDDDELDLIFKVDGHDSADDGFYQAIGYRENGEYQLRSTKISDEEYGRVESINLDDDKELELIAIKKFGADDCDLLDIYDLQDSTYVLMDTMMETFDTLCFKSNANYNDITIADINGDSRPDVTLRNYSDPYIYSVFFGTEDPNVYNKTRIPFSGTLQTVADVNVDGKYDLMFFNENQDSIFMIEWGETDSFDINLVAADVSFSTFRMHVTNLDMDMELELAYYDSDKDSMYLVNNLGTENTEVFSIFKSDGTFGTWLDTNFDGNLDYFSRVSNSSVGFGELFVNDGGGIFTKQDGFNNLEHFDFRNDFVTKIDLENKVAEYYFGTNVGISMNINNNEEWSSRTILADLLNIETIDDIEAADVDGDEIADIIFCSRWGSVLGYFKGLPDSTYSEPIAIDFGVKGPYDISTADVNADGYLDLIYSTIWGEGQIWVAYGDGNGDYSAKQRITKYFGLIRGMVVGDFFNDGYPDIIVSSIESGLVRILKNVEGIFLEEETIGVLESPSELFKVDLNNDGHLDLFANSIGGGSFVDLVQFTNSANGTFENSQPWLQSESTSIRFVDIDADGEDEIVSYLDGELRIDKIENGVPVLWRSIDDLNFGNALFFVVDYDGDSFQDILFRSGSRTSIYQNNNNEDWTFEGYYDDIIESENADLVLLEREEWCANLDVDDDGDRDFLFVTELGDLYLVLDQKSSTTSLNPEIETTNEIKVFPNPSNSFIELDMVPTEFQSLSIFNSHGVSVHSTTNNSKVLNIANLSKGLYFIVIHHSEGQDISKFYKY